MHIRGIVQSATLVESEPEGESISMVLKVQGVGPGQPRTLTVPYSLLLADESLDADEIRGRGFEADVEQDADGRWLVSTIAFASRVLRPPE